MAELGAAVVGCRAVGPLHAKALTRARGARLVAVCDIDAEAATALARQYGVDAVTDYEAVLQRDDVQLVNIVTPDELHAPMAIAAAKAGKHALVEKPFAMTLAEMDAVTSAAAAAGVRMMCAQSMRFRPKFRMIRDAIAKGDIGRAVFARMSSPSSPFWTRATWTASARNMARASDWLLVHNGMHQFDYLALLFESFPSEVYTIAHPGQDWLAVSEYVAVNMRFENGAIALSEENRIMQPPEHPFHCDVYLVGTQGTLEAGDRQTFSTAAYSSNGLQFPGAHIGAWEAEEAFRAEVQAIVDAIQENREPEIPLSFTRRVLGAVRAACRSLVSGENERAGAEEGAR